MALVIFCVTTTLFLLFVCRISISHAMLHQLSDVHILERHEAWMYQHGRSYKDTEEKIKRLEIFKDNVRKIEAFNAGPDQGYKLGVNAFADMTSEEIRAFYTGYKRQIYPKRFELSSQHKHFRYANVTSVPATMDWRKKGAVTPVKNQKICESCWAFSAVGAVEGINQIKTGKLVSLSEQELIDCDIRGENEGCHGGYMDKAFEFIIKNKGLRKESDYPYTASDDNCKIKKASRKASVKITGYENVPENDEKSLLLAVAHQPISVGLAASSHNFEFYSSGVISGGCGTDLDHGAVVVGYGRTSDGTKYWLVKNSWGESWGEKGYVRIKRGVSE